MSRKDELRLAIERHKEYLKEQTDLAKGILDRSLMVIREDLKKLQDELEELVSQEDKDE